MEIEEKAQNHYLIAAKNLSIGTKFHKKLSISNSNTVVFPYHGKIIIQFMD
jgi:hypothetical protein